MARVETGPEGEIDNTKGDLVPWWPTSKYMTNKACVYMRVIVRVRAIADRHVQLPTVLFHIQDTVLFNFLKLNLHDSRKRTWFRGRGWVTVPLIESDIATVPVR
jgi:hypothetical protein